MRYTVYGILDSFKNEIGERSTDYDATRVRYDRLRETKDVYFVQWFSETSYSVIAH